ncbi:MAG: hypothetical protein IKE69_12260 [Thermoguttaceae bacterium]|nr:hypothetical protein [Thermoguttaceae bacterium]
MSEIQTEVFSKHDELSIYADPDPIKLLTDVEEAIRSLDEHEDEPVFCTVSDEAEDRFFSSISTDQIVALLAIPEPGAPKKRGRRPKPRTPGEMPVKKTKVADPLWSDEDGRKRRRHIDPTTCERDYSDDEVEFMKALDRYKKLNGRLFPTCSETLEVIRRLGYVKMPPAHESAPNEPAYASPPPCAEAAESQEIAAPRWTGAEVFVVEA